MEIKQIIGIIGYIGVFTFPFIACILIRKRSVSFKAWLLSLAVSWSVMTFTVLVLWLGYDWYLSYEMGLLDSDGDGIWSDNEMSSWTEKDHKIMEKYYADGGRNVFAAFIFPIFSLVYSIFITAIYWTIANLRRKNA